MITRY